METEGRSDNVSQAPAHSNGEGEDRFSFSKFAAHPFFKEVNEWLVSHAAIKPGIEVVDLGCGPGAVTEIILRSMGAPPRGHVFAIDPSSSALVLAAQRIQSAVVRFIQGTAERISSLVPPPVDTVVFCNAIHLVPDKAQVISGISKVLRPGGVLAFNTTFFDGAYPGDTYRFYKLWVLRARRWLQERGHGITRGVKATAMQWLSPDDYRRLLESTGFSDTQFEFQVKDLNCQAWEDISEFSMFIEGALPGVPLEIGAEALKVGVRQAMEELSLRVVPRIWLQAIARRT